MLYNSYIVEVEIGTGLIAPKEEGLQVNDLFGQVHLSCLNPRFAELSYPQWRIRIFLAVLSLDP